MASRLDDDTLDMYGPYVIQDGISGEEGILTVVGASKDTYMFELCTFNQEGSLVTRVHKEHAMHAIKPDNVSISGDGTRVEFWYFDKRDNKLIVSSVEFDIRKISYITIDLKGDGEERESLVCTSWKGNQAASDFHIEVRDDIRTASIVWSAYYTDRAHYTNHTDLTDYFRYEIPSNAWNDMRSDSIMDVCSWERGFIILTDCNVLLFLNANFKDIQHSVILRTGDDKQGTVFTEIRMINNMLMVYDNHKFNKTWYCFFVNSEWGYVKIVPCIVPTVD